MTDWTKQFVLIMALMLISVNAAAEVRVFTLHQRSAEEIVEQVRTLLNSDEKAQAAGSHLVVIAAEESLEAVEKLLLLIDRRPVDLIVQIRLMTVKVGLSPPCHQAGSGPAQRKPHGIWEMDAQKRFSICASRKDLRLGWKSAPTFLIAQHGLHGRAKSMVIQKILAIRS